MVAVRPFGSRDKYSVEQIGFQMDTAAMQNNDNPPFSQGAVTIVPPVDFQGMRKVKHVTVSLVCQRQATSSIIPGPVVRWALVYVPAGTNVGAISWDNTGLYEPNQFVMACGLGYSQAGPIRISSPLSRNLNSGDKISLVVMIENSNNSNPCTISGVAQYAITLQ